MKIKINVVDAFTHVRFKGNPAAVVITGKWLSDEKMQEIAAENNLSETAFLVEDENGTFAIRWFSPLTEIDFCGHATLASAFVIFSENYQLQHISLFAKSVGMMKVIKRDDGFIQMDFPNRMPIAVDEIPEGLVEGLSIKPNSVLKNEQAYFAVYSDEDDVLSVIQNSDMLKTLAPFDVVVTAPGTQFDFVSRYFWPANGGDEDPVTGSIHTGLAPFWAKRLGKSKLVAYQASKRGGTLKCEVTGDRVLISGQAVSYLEGYITI
ncbi:phenazine biosynthesis protein PhzF [Tenacibaculum sp. KUL118]|nr:phenazine biosynthesis protein PhzF [Tenacibaculum sp. KUL118]